METKPTIAQTVGLWLTFASAAVTVVFIFFKLFGVISWSWWWVVAPFLIPFAIVLVAVILLVIIANVYAPKDLY